MDYATAAKLIGLLAFTGSFITLVGIVIKSEFSGKK